MRAAQDALQVVTVCAETFDQFFSVCLPKRPVRNHEFNPVLVRVPSLDSGGEADSCRSVSFVVARKWLDVEGDQHEQGDKAKRANSPVALLLRFQRRPMPA